VGTLVDSSGKVLVIRVHYFKLFLLKISGLFQKGSTDPQDSSVRHTRTGVDNSTSPVQVELLKGETVSVLVAGLQQYLNHCVGTAGGTHF
jgi:hypothetical protein